MTRPKKPNPDSKKAQALLGAILRWAFVLLGLGTIAGLIATAPKEKQLNCRRTADTSLIGFGTCSDD